jgi:hypothetical protein
VFLSELHNATDTRDVDHNGTVMLTVLGEQTEECGGDEVHREYVDLVQLCPLLRSLFIKHGHSKSLGICVLWRVFLVQEFGHGADLSSAGVLVRFGSQ